MVELIADPPRAVVTVTRPVVAPAGTMAVMLVEVLAVTFAVVPLNLTLLLDGVALKFVPLIVTIVPSGPLAGANEVMATMGCEIGNSDNGRDYTPLNKVPAKRWLSFTAIE